MIKLLFFHFRVTNANFKKYYITLWVTNPIPGDIENSILDYFFRDPLNKIIFTSWSVIDLSIFF